jgi:hypothetical protein
MEIINDQLVYATIIVNNHKFNIAPNTTFHIIKQMIATKLGCESTDFTVCGIETDRYPKPTTTIENINLDGNNKKWCLTYHNFTFAQLFVKTLTGKTLTLICRSRDLVFDLKQQIAEHEGILPENQRLIFGGRQLIDENTLCESKFSKEITVYLSYRLRGGMHHITSANYQLSDNLTIINVTIMLANYSDLKNEHVIKIKTTDTIQHLLNILKENKLLEDDKVILPDNINLETNIKDISKKITIKTNDIIKITYTKGGPSLTKDASSLMTYKYKANLNMTVKAFLDTIYYGNSKASIVIDGMMMILNETIILKEIALNDSTVMYIS